MSTLIHKRVSACRANNFPGKICRVNSGWVVMGDVQFVAGYCLLLPDPVVENLNSLAAPQRQEFLLDMTVLGDVLLDVTGALRINYEIIGNLEPALHAHLFPRYKDEPAELATRPVWFYNWENAPEFDVNRDAALMQKIRDGLAARGAEK